MTHKERSITFSGEEVQATLAGRKTQFRRPIKWRPRRPEHGPRFDRAGVEVGFYHSSQERSGYVLRERRAGLWNDLTTPTFCPYQVGMRLWVREALAWKCDEGQITHGIKHPDELRLVYAADGVEPAMPPDWKPTINPYSGKPRNITSIHMPRWASRLTLLVTDVRVQRVQEISEEDAVAEGMQCPGIPAAINNRSAFVSVWNSTYGPGAWKRNDWVWAIGFEVVK